MTAPALSEFELKVQQIMAAYPGVPREKAEQSVRMNFPALAPKPELVDRHDNVLEKEEQAYIAKLFKGFGCKVYNLSQARASKQTPGLPDLWVVHKARGVAFWFEVKRSKEFRISDAQAEFRVECTAAGINHCWGDRRTAAKLLIDLGLARVGDGPCGIVPFHEGR